MSLSRNGDDNFNFLKRKIKLNIIIIHFFGTNFDFDREREWSDLLECQRMLSKTTRSITHSLSTGECPFPRLETTDSIFFFFWFFYNNKIETNRSNLVQLFQRMLSKMTCSISSGLLTGNVLFPDWR
jgi:hypothetical protein